MKSSYLLILASLFLSFSLTGQELSIRYKNYRYGVMDSDDKIIIPFEYTLITQDSVYFFCSNDGLTEVYSQYGELLVPKSDNISFVKRSNYGESKYYEFHSASTNLWGLYNSEMKQIIPPEYSSVQKMYGSDYLEFSSPGHVFKGLADDKGNIIIKATKYSYIDKPRNGYIEVKRGNKYGICNLNGQEILPAVYDYVQIIQDGFIVRNDIYYSALSSNGLPIIPDGKYTNLSFNSNNNSFSASCGPQKFVLDNKGKVLMSTDKYSSLKLSNDGTFYIVSYGKNKGKLGLNGEIIDKPQFEKDTTIVCDDYVFTKTSDGVGHYGIDAPNIKIERIYDYVHYKDNFFSCGSYTKNGRTECVYDKNGKLIIPLNKYSSTMFYKEHFIVFKNTKQGICTKDGVELIPPIYSDITTFDEGFRIQDGIYEGRTDRSGKVIIPCVYSGVTYMSDDDNYIINLFGKKGICSLSGSVIIPPKYDDVLFMKEKGYFLLRNGKYEGFALRNGTIILEPQYFTDIYYYSYPSVIVANNNDHERRYSLEGKVIYDSKNSESRDEYIDKADDYFSKRQYKKSLEYYSKANELWSDCSVLCNIGACYWNLGNDERAVSYMRQALDNNPTSEVHTIANKILQASEQTKSKRNSSVGTNILNIFSSILNTFSNYYNPFVARAQYDSYYYTPTFETSSLDALTNQVMNQALQQSQQQLEQEYNLYHSFYPNATMDDYLNAKALASYQIANDNQSNNNDYFTSNNGNISSNENYDYRQQYSRWEEQAKSVYESMTIGGYSSSSGGHANLNNLPAGGYSQYHNLLRNAQAEMRKTRIEAGNAGINIPMSNWETISVDCYK